MHPEECTDYREELRILNDALEQVGNKGELKVSEWIRGSKISCVLSLVQYELRSIIIKKNGFYAVNSTERQRSSRK